MWIYYPRYKVVNRPRKRFARTIFMSNHAASFMDPLVIAIRQPPIVFFMTRADIFTPLMKPILWAAHMLPIYRQLDGKDTKRKNEEVFKKCANILKYGRSLLIFSEGFTDDVFIRRLKPVKKGAVRIGFLALEECNWSKEIFVQAVGVNYSDPNLLGSDCVLSNGDPVCLNDYRKEYEKDANKVINDLTFRMEGEMRDQITDIRDIEMTGFHEQIMRLTRKGMNAIDSDKSIPLEERWQYSKRLADWFNANDLSKNSDILSLKERINTYFRTQEANGVEESIMYKLSTNQRNKTAALLSLALLSPIMLVGLLLNYIPYRFTKNFVEKSFKRSVFWGSVKMVLGSGVVGIYNFLLALIISLVFGVSLGMLLLVGIVVVILSGVVAYNWFRTLNEYKKLNKTAKKDLTELVMEREELLEKIYELIPVA